MYVARYVVYVIPAIMVKSVRNVILFTDSWSFVLLSFTNSFTVSAKRYKPFSCIISLAEHNFLSLIFGNENISPY